MKRIFTATLLILATALGKADVIVLTDGSTLDVHNVEVATKWVYYTESSDADAATKKVAIDEVFAYKIGDGQLTVISKGDEKNNTASATADTGGEAGSRMISPKPAANNAALISSYNDHPALVHNSKKPSPGKYSETFLSLWGIEDGSILSDENIEIGFEKVYADILKKRRVVGNRIKVYNKTDSPIYIDLASSFKILNGGYSQPYYSNASYTEGGSNTKGASLNLGAVAGALGIGGGLGTLASGINVGGANTRSASVTKGEQQILMIPPHSSILLPGDKISNGSTLVECYEPIFFNNKGMENTNLAMGMARDVMMKLEPVQMTMIQDEQCQQIKDNQNVTSSSLGISRWQETSFTPEESPKKIGRIITYSTSPDFNTYTSLPFTLYMRGAFGVKVMFVGDDLFTDDWYDVITDKDHFIVGHGFIRK